MPTFPPPPQGFLGLPDLGGIVDQVTKLLPPEVGNAIQNTIGGILGDGPINIGDPQPPGERPIPVEPGSKELSSAVKALDTAIGALNVLTKLDFLIPKQYQDLLTKLQGALTTVRGWLD
jgi:hypothetical protein